MLPSISFIKLCPCGIRILSTQSTHIYIQLTTTTKVPTIHSQMCKRTVTAHSSGLKRLKKETSTYTQGPLDEKFGQHRAFPLDGAPSQGKESSVYEYLASVRKEAESDSPVHFVTRKTLRLTPRQIRKTTELSSKYVNMVMRRLQQEKQAHQQDHEIQLETIELDFDDGIDITERLEEVESQDDIQINALNHQESFETEQHHQIPTECGLQDESESERENGSDLPAVPQSAGQWRSLVFSQSPPPMEFFTSSLQHATIIKLIVYYTKWLLVSMPATLAEWIFMTFVRLDNGLDHTELSLVRDLGRKARKLRAKFAEGKKEGVSIPNIAEDTVDMILAVVGTYYGQRDLLVDE